METIWRYNICTDGKKLSGDVKCDTVVVGGGLCGTLTAYTLSRAGLKTVLLEAGKLGSGQSRGTTAKITLCHGDKLSQIENSFGTDAVMRYVRGEMASIQRYERIIKEENIDCNFERLPAYLYALYGERHIRREFETAQKCGLECELTRSTELPFEVSLALKIDGQAQFDPISFIGGIMNGFDVYEETRAVELFSDGVICDDGKVTAKHVIIATNYPALCDVRGLFPLKLHREMAHVCTFGNTDKLNGMYIGIDGGYNYRSFGDELIVSGESHVSGLGSGGAYERIRKSTLSHFSGATVGKGWSAEDSESLDGLAYIGKLKSNKTSVYVATGFGTWGMTTSMTAADLICDLVCGRNNDLAGLYSPSRFKMDSSADELADGVTRAVKDIAFSRLRNSDEADGIPRDFGMIVRHKGRKSAVYKDKNGELHVSEPYCPHMKCELKWNDDDKTWDCPCHGSRFDFDGNLISGPSEENI